MMRLPTNTCLYTITKPLNNETKTLYAYRCTDAVISF